ncbi:MAG: hypothetical protein WCX95_01830 [Candidatus Gracilibacteria bacterium]
MSKEQKIVKVKGGGTKAIQHYLNDGWEVKSSHSVGQGYSGSKTCCWGCLFLPLALLGRKKDAVEYVLERETPKEHSEKAEKSDTSSKKANAK